jgi:hypothetical protein
MKILFFAVGYGVQSETNSLCFFRCVQNCAKMSGSAVSVALRRTNFSPVGAWGAPDFTSGRRRMDPPPTAIKWTIRQFLKVFLVNL